MTYKEIQELIRQVSKSDLAEVKVKDGESEVTIRTKYYSSGAQREMPAVYTTMAPQVTSVPTATVESNVEAPAKPKESAPATANTSNLREIRSPMVGTFYRSSGPDKPPYVKPGDSVSAGSVVCIIEAMKLFNEIESDISGTIVKVLVEDASPVEYDQVLFLVE